MIITMAAPKDKDQVITIDIMAKLLIGLLTAVVSMGCWIGVRTMNKVDELTKNVNDLKEVFATYKEKVNQLEKSEPKK